MKKVYVFIAILLDENISNVLAVFTEKNEKMVDILKNYFLSHGDFIEDDEGMNDLNETINSLILNESYYDGVDLYKLKKIELDQFIG